MKRQQLFYSFLPGVTAAVLTTQSAWAGTATVSPQQLTAAPIVISATRNSSVASNSNGQLPDVGVGVGGFSFLALNSELDNFGLGAFNNDVIDNKALPTPVKSTKYSTIGRDCLTLYKQSPSILLLEPNRCAGVNGLNAYNGLLAQANPMTSPNSPATNGSQSDSTSGSESPANTGPTPVPEQMNHNPNPLAIPTSKEEVTVAETTPITLGQALELAKHNNNDLQVTILQLEQSKFALRQAQAALFPTLGVTTSIANSRDAGTTLSNDLANQQGANYTTASNTAFNGQAQLSYSLYTSGQRKASIRQQEEQVRYQELAVETKSEDIRLNVATAYYNLQQADAQVQINQEAVVNAEASLRDASNLEKAGVGTKFDVLTAQVNLANAQQNVVSAIAQQQIARRQLATLMNTSEMTNISAADPVKLAGLWDHKLEDSIVMAYQNRPELQEQLAQRNIYEQQRRQALSALGPQVNFVASYSLEELFNNHLPASDGYSVGIQATLNLYDGGAAKAKAAQAKSNILITETQFSEQRNQIRFQVEQAYYTQKSNLDNVETANLAVVQAKEALRLARLRFQAGVGTQTDVINSENNLTTAEGNQVKAVLNYNIALTQIQRYVFSRVLSSR